MNACAECGFDCRLDPEAAIEIIAGGRHRITWVAALGGHGLGVRPEPPRWSVLEYAAHLAEALRWYCDRITRVLTEERPQLESFDFDRACRDGGYGTRPIDSVLAEVEDAACRLTAVTEPITAEGWARTGIGSEGTDRTASILAARAAHEVVHHGIDMARTVLQTADPARAPLDLQMLVLLIAVRQNPVAVDVMQAAAACHLPDWYLGAGAVAQTVWNLQHGLPPAAGIKDYDLVYYDAEDLSERGERAVEAGFSDVAERLGIAVDVTNEARVHTWFERRFGRAIEAYRSTEHAISTWPTTASSVGIRLAGDELSVCAPYGLTDLFGMVVRPNRALVTNAVYQEKAERWQAVWPRLTVEPW